MGRRWCKVPIVPRPPILSLPNLRKGAEHVTMLGVTWRMAITLDGSWGMSFSVMVGLFTIDVCRLDWDVSKVLD